MFYLFSKQPTRIVQRLLNSSQARPWEELHNGPFQQANEVCGREEAEPIMRLALTRPSDRLMWSGHCDTIRMLGGCLGPECNTYGRRRRI